MIRDGFGSAGGGGPGGNRNRIPNNKAITKHIFRDKTGHLPDTPQNRELLEEVSNSQEYFLGSDRYGNCWHAKILQNGTQIWTESRNGKIIDGGLNNIPKQWNDLTGLKKE